MSADNFDAVRHFGEKLSSVYDQRIREILPGYEAMHDLALYFLEQSTGEKATILIAGVGTGHETVCCAARRPAWKIVGFDPSAEMLAVAGEKVKSLKDQGNITLIHGTIGDISPDISFDAATSILVLQFLPDNGEKQQYLREISKRLATGARIVIIDLEGLKYSEEYHLLMSAWKAQQIATRKDGTQIEKDFQHVEKHVHLVPEERLRELLTAAGFRNICKFYKSLLLGGYTAVKGEQRACKR